MKRTNRRTFIAAGAAAAAVALQPRAARAADLPIIRVGSLPADTTAVVNYAQELGYFKNAGIDVQINFMNSGPVIANAVTGGSLDVGAINTGSLAVARSKGIPLKFFAADAVATESLMTDVIMVRKDSPIQSGADFEGKTVAIVAMKTMQHAAFLLWVDKHGGDSKTVKFIEIPFPDMVAALAQKRVDAAIPVEPFTAAGRAENRVLGNVYGSMPPNFMIFGFFATDAWLQAHPDLAVKFAGAIRQAAIWANGHQKESAAMVVKFTKVDPALIGVMQRPVYGTSLDPAMIKPVIDNIVRYGMLDKPMNPDDIIWRAPK